MGREIGSLLRAALAALGCWVAVLGLVGCDEDLFGSGCTEAGCGDGLSVAVALGDALGGERLALRLSVDGEQSECQLQDSGEYQVVECGEGVAASLGPVTVCESSRDGSGNEHQVCRPSGGLSLELRIDGTPAAVELELTAGAADATLFQLAPEYESFAPNGPGCGPVCEVAAIDLTLP